MKMHTTVILIVMSWAMMGPGGGRGAWFEDYVNSKDKLDVEVEGEILDIPVDGEGESKTDCY